MAQVGNEPRVNRLTLQGNHGRGIAKACIRGHTHLKRGVGALGIVGDPHFFARRSSPPGQTENTCRRSEPCWTCSVTARKDPTV